jgi:hypothetical protein
MAQWDALSTTLQPLILRYRFAVLSATNGNHVDPFSTMKPGR